MLFVASANPLTTTFQITITSRQAPNARIQFALRLKELRLARGLSQEALAELSGLHRTYVGSVERAERNVSIDNIERLAGALSVKMRDLFGADAFWGLLRILKFTRLALALRSVGLLT